jgi:hypothetical protein
LCQPAVGFIIPGILRCQSGDIELQPKRATRFHVVGGSVGVSDIALRRTSKKSKNGFNTFDGACPVRPQVFYGAGSPTEWKTLGCDLIIPFLWPLRVSGTRQDRWLS